MSDVAEPHEYEIGAHSLRIEPPDVYIIRHVNDITLEEVQGFLRLIGVFIAGKDGVYAIVDYSRAGGMTSEARRALLGQMSKAHAGIVFTQVSAVAKVGISLGRKAYLMMTRGQDTPFTFADTLDEAYAWIAAQRAARKSGNAK